MDLRERAPPAARPTWCVQAGTAVSTRLRHGTCNSVNLIHWSAASRGQERQCVVERCDYRPDRGWFETAERRTLLLGP
jgi:hypothetical protein